MEFCKVCHNMLYLKTEVDQSLTRYCKCCSFQEQDPPTRGKSICVSKTMYAEDDLLYMQHNNPYIRYDPTLPRVKDPSLVCQNADCPGSTETSQMIYVKYHPVQLRYFYVCDLCGQSFRKKN